MRQIILASALGISSTAAVADQYHYANMLIGDRAIGLGGAYAGVSDDASGVAYNPAGLAFALSNELSGSANALYRRNVRYKKTIGDKDFIEQSEGVVPAFFGGLQKLDSLWEGSAFAFGIFSTDSELKDQDDVIEDQQLSSTVLVDRFHRTANARASTVNWAAGAAKRIGTNFAIGVGASYVMIDELAQVYQDSTTLDASTGRFQTLVRNNRVKLSVAALEPSIGFQWTLASRLSLGLAVRIPVIITDKMEISGDSTCFFASTSAPSQVLTNCTTPEFGNTEEGTEPDRTYTREPSEGKFEDVMKEMPKQIRFGSALFATTRLLWTFDVAHYTATTTGSYQREAVTNFHSGIEYFVIPALPIRLGVFTNNDARPEIDPAKSGQDDHIDYLGGTFFLAWVQQNSQISAGLMSQRGSGKSQKLGTRAVQDVVAEANTFAFAASQNF